MKKRAFYLASTLLVLIALFFHFVARAQIVEAQHLRVKSREAAMEKQTQVVTDPTAKRLSDSARVLNKVGLAFAICSLTFLVVAGIRREHGWYSIPILLLFFDLIEQLLL